MAIVYNDYGTRKFSEDELREAIRAIKAGNAADAIFCLQRAFGHDTDMVEMIESEWRRK